LNTWSKLGTALAIFVSGQVLQWGGYISQAGEGSVVQPESVPVAVRLVIGPIPMVVLVAAIFVMQFYILDRKEYRERSS